jgi:hypothetical protein
MRQKHAYIFLTVLALSCTAAHAGEVRVVRPVTACESIDVDDPCTPSVLKLGEKFDVDTDYRSRPNIVLLWRRTCPSVDHGCVPAATPSVEKLSSTTRSRRPFRTRS